MSDLTHESLGARERRRHLVQDAELGFKKERVRKYFILPWKHIQLDQAAVWFVLFTIASCAFLYCTVSVVRLAVR